MSNRHTNIARHTSIAERAARATSYAAEVPDGARREGEAATDRVRLSVDVPPLMLDRLGRALPDLAADAGRRRVRQSEVVRALLDELEASPALRSIVVDRLREL